MNNKATCLLYDLLTNKNKQITLFLYNGISFTGKILENDSEIIVIQNSDGFVKILVSQVVAWSF
jgi:sRNA-binding regulator protein Hfq